MINKISGLRKTVFLVPALAAITLLSCHSGGGSEPGNAADSSKMTTNSDTAMNTTATAPVVVATDDSLKMGIKDAVKDYPGVNATADNGEITLTGEVMRSKLQPLMMSLNSLHPKKINNKLTIK